jgi:spermidine/putrescine transport system substrate-binding protein
MWGTVGFIYNPEFVSEEEASTWNLLWNPDIKSTAKDSIRDTYMVGVMYVYQDELNDLKHKLDNGIISQKEYTSKVGEIMNRCDDDTLDKVEDALILMKNAVYGFEVDSGKNDIVTGKIAVNLAWSGDAVYSMDVAEEEEEVYLNYSVPKEGSNVWFDGWVMPKGANTLLAQSFVNFLCSPEIAVRNMNKIGYTSAIVGDEVMDMINDWYGVEDGEEGYEVDLTYLFTDSLSDEYYTINDQGEKRAIVTVSERGRQFDAQYPDEETIMRCGIMEDFGDRIDNVIAMWENVKIGDISIWFTILLIVFVVIIFVFMYGKKIIDKHKKKMRRLKYSK